MSIKMVFPELQNITTAAPICCKGGIPNLHVPEPDLRAWLMCWGQAWHAEGKLNTSRVERPADPCLPLLLAKP